MSAIIEAFMGRSRTTLILMAVMIGAGVYFYLTLPREADPDIPIPFIYVSVPYPGVSPEDAERLLVRPLETELSGVEGLKEYTSTASQGHAGVALEFDVSFDKDKALADVREKVDLVRPKLPDGIEEPEVREFNVSLFPVIIVALSGPVPERTLFNYARRLQEEIERLPNVLEANLIGQREELLEIVIDSSQIEALGLSYDDLLIGLTRNNRLITAGALETGRGRFAVKVPGLYETRDDVLAQPIRVTAQGGVTLGDVGGVRRTFKEPQTYARFNGQPAIAIEVTKRLGKNIVETNHQIRALGAEFAKHLPETVRIGFTLDTSSWIHRSLASLQSSIMTAVLLVMIVVVGTLGLRSGLLVGVAIPSSFMIAFLFLGAGGQTINMMVMFGMVLSVGLLVDGAIVVVEYADRKMAEGLDRRQAYALSARRMFWPITSSTATTLAAFVPMLFWPGVSGQFMSYLPMTLIIVLSASLGVALIFLPVIGSLTGKTVADANERARLAQLAGGGTTDISQFTGLVGGYVRLLRPALHRPGSVLLVTGVIVAGVIYTFVQFNRGTEFFVQTEPELASVLISARGNLSVGDMRALTTEVEREVLATPGIMHAFSRIGDAGVGSFGPRDDGPSDLIASILIEMGPYGTRRPGAQILEEIRTRTADLAGIQVEVRQLEEGPPTGKDVQLEFTGQNRETLFASMARVRGWMEENVAGLIDFEDSRPLPGIEWSLDFDREIAGRFGADITSLGAVVQLVTNGILVGEYRPDDADDELDIRVRFPREGRVLDQLDALRISTRNGLVPVSNFVSRSPQPRIDSISRVNGLRRGLVKANTAVDPETGLKILADTKVREIAAWLETQEFPPGIRWSFRGANEEQAESAVFLSRALLASLCLMFLILITQFNSIYHSVLTLSTVVLAVIGVLIGMLVTGQTFSVIMTGTGIVALAGIVVNNSIVMIDTYQRLHREIPDRIEAVLHTAAQRLRPILLTTITTICGLLPMALQINIDWLARTVALGGIVSVWWVQLATAIVFGLGFATLITLLLIPVMLAAPVVVRENFKRWTRPPRLQRSPAE